MDLICEDRIYSSITVFYYGPNNDLAINCRRVIKFDIAVLRQTDMERGD